MIFPLSHPAPDIRVYIFDLDGVLYRGSEAVDGAAESLTALRARADGPRLFFLTNNSSQPRREYVEKLTGMGMFCSEDEMVTSSSATAFYLTNILQAPAGQTVLCVGGDGIRDEMNRAGYTVVRTDEPEVEGQKIDFVVAGMDRNFNYQTLYRAQQAILRGATFLATNRDGQYPIEGGKVTPGGGAMVAAIEACTDTSPVVLGKPEPLGLEAVLQMAGCAPHEALFVGDRLDTDILCGNRVGVPTALVLTGVTTEGKARAATGDLKPGRIIHTLRDLL